MKIETIHRDPMEAIDRPHYDVSIIMAPATFESIAGVLFEAMLAFDDGRQPLHGKLTVPQDLNDPSLNLAMNAWLWLEEHIVCEAGSRFIVQLKRPCDTTHQSDRIDELKPYSGYTFVGFIHRNWNL
jgi:hypothetical protein